ncbi:hypothetical protein ABPG75_012260 [Micractinium tetrahymenae]
MGWARPAAVYPCCSTPPRKLTHMACPCGRPRNVESPSSEGTNAESGDSKDDLHTRVGRLEHDVAAVKKMSDDLDALKAGTTPFLKKQQESLDKMLKWQKYTTAFMACAGLATTSGAAFFFRHLWG